LASASSRRLTDLCRAEGLRHDRANSALADADATARLLAVYLKRATAAGIVTAVDLGVAPLLIPTSETAPAASAAVRIRTTPPLDRRSLPADATGDPRLDAYLDLLKGVLADHVITADEERRLAELVIASGLDPRRVAACRHAVSLSPHAETAP
jgi:ATP-dependent Lhr-like helicase